MKIQEILSQLKFFKNSRLPRKALQAAIEQKEEITPYLLEILQDAIDDTQKYVNSRTLMWQTYAVFLLAQFREPKAYPLIIELLSKPDDIPFALFGDSVTEDMGRIIASVCHDDLSLIKKLIEDEDINEYVRSTCLRVLISLYVEGELEREKIIEYLQSLFQHKLSRENHFIWAALVDTCNDFYATCLLGEIRKAFDENLLEEGVIDLDYVEETFKRSEDEVLSELYTGSIYSFPTDTIAELQQWASFKTIETRPEKLAQAAKIGRNDPCPCGSGKKYKKCCLI